MGRVLVVGVGNSLMSDDAFGLVVLRKLRECFRIPPEITLLEGEAIGVDLIYYLEGVEKLLILDIVLGGGKPGRVYRLKGERIVHLRRRLSLHSFGVEEVLGLAEVLGRRPEVVAIGVEPKVLEPGTGLSEEVRRSVPKVIELVVSQLEEWGVKIERGW